MIGRNGRGWIVFSGFLFALGLVVSGMTSQDKVSAFLDVAGHWDPSLALVMVGALLVYFGASRLARRVRNPLYSERFPAPPDHRVDARLLIGAALFGIGWGLSGFCPGPALVSIGAGAHAALWFVPAMIVGMAIHRLVDAKRQTDCR